MNHFTSSTQNPELALCEKSFKVFSLVGEEEKEGVKMCSVCLLKNVK